MLNYHVLNKLAAALGLSEKRLILHADDDPMVRRIAARMLDRLGYGCLSASDGAECLRSDVGTSAASTAPILSMALRERMFPDRRQYP